MKRTRFSRILAFLVAVIMVAATLIPSGFTYRAEAAETDSLVSGNDAGEESPAEVTASQPTPSTEQSENVSAESAAQSADASSAVVADSSEANASADSTEAAVSTATAAEPKATTYKLTYDAGVLSDKYLAYTTESAKINTYKSAHFEEWKGKEIKTATGTKTVTEIADVPVFMLPADVNNVSTDASVTAEVTGADLSYPGYTFLGWTELKDDKNSTTDDYDQLIEKLTNDVTDAEAEAAKKAGKTVVKTKAEAKAGDVVDSLTDAERQEIINGLYRFNEKDDQGKKKTSYKDTYKIDSTSTAKNVSVGTDGIVTATLTAVVVPTTADASEAKAETANSSFAAEESGKSSSSSAESASETTSSTANSSSSSNAESTTESAAANTSSVVVDESGTASAAESTEEEKSSKHTFKLIYSAGELAKSFVSMPKVVEKTSEDESVEFDVQEDLSYNGYTFLGWTDKTGDDLTTLLSEVNDTDEDGIKEIQKSLYKYNERFFLGLFKKTHFEDKVELSTDPEDSDYAIVDENGNVSATLTALWKKDAEASSTSESAESVSSSISENAASSGAESVTASVSESTSSSADENATPVFTDEQTIDNAKISINAPEGALPENTAASVSAITDSSAITTAAVEEKLKEQLGDSLKSFLAYDITFTDAEGSVVEPDKAVSVSISFDDDAVNLGNDEQIKVYHLGLNEDRTEITSVEEISDPTVDTNTAAEKKDAESSEDSDTVSSAESDADSTASAKKAPAWNWDDEDTSDSETSDDAANDNEDAADTKDEQTGVKSVSFSLDKFSIVVIADTTAASDKRTIYFSPWNNNSSTAEVKWDAGATMYVHDITNSQIVAMTGTGMTDSHNAEILKAEVSSSCTKWYFSTSNYTSPTVTTRSVNIEDSSSTTDHYIIYQGEDDTKVWDGMSTKDNLPKTSDNGKIDVFYASNAAWNNQKRGVGTHDFNIIGLNLSPSIATVTVGGTRELTATVTGLGSSPSVSFKSSNTDVATVTDQGVVTGVAEGTATITALTTVNGINYTDETTVNVEKEKIVYFSTSGLTWSDAYYDWTPSMSTLYYYLYNSDTDRTEVKSVTPSSALIDPKSDSAKVFAIDASGYSSIRFQSVETTTDAQRQTVMITIGSNNYFTLIPNSNSGSKYEKEDNYELVAASNVNITDLTLSASPANISVNAASTVTATLKDTSDSVASWSSSNDAIATVSGSGNTATVTGVSQGVAVITATTTNGYTATVNIVVGTPGNTVYYDATLSKLKYTKFNDNSDYSTTEDGAKTYSGIPGASSSGSTGVWIYLSDTKGSTGGTANQMTLVNGTDYLYSYTPTDNKVYKYARFASTQEKAQAAPNGTSSGEETVETEIDWSYSEPTFYGDTSDNVIYKNTNSDRGGYWANKGTTRDPDKEAGGSVVDIPNGTKNYASSVTTFKSTLYDYFSDYELNGLNRDNFTTDNAITTHEIYQEFRQFNQALSGAYTTSNPKNALYWGNFQNFTGDPFWEIAYNQNTLWGGSSDAYSSLFSYPSGFWHGSFGSVTKEYDSEYYHPTGTDAQKYYDFFYYNNSMFDKAGKLIGDYNGTKDGAQAVQGLVGNNLTSDGSSVSLTGTNSIAPFFDESFLSGTNNKRTKLGEVYKNVDFPFEQQAMKTYLNSGNNGETGTAPTESNGTVDYWLYDSSQASLQLKNSSDGYYLEKSSTLVNGQKADGANSAGGLFPFNTTAQSGNAKTLNYGYAVKLEIPFRLTEAGTVKTSANETVPIEFQFSGDDDVWVFIDGKLALDIGGAHGAVSGYLDFQHLTSYVSRIKNDSSAGGVTYHKYGTFTLNGEKEDEHTLTMFYIERGEWESNMKVSFSFPQNNQLEVQKEVDTSDVANDFKDAFKNAIFTYTLKTEATHGTHTDASGVTQSPDISVTIDNLTVPTASSYNLFRTVSDNIGGETGSIQWYVDSDDLNGTSREARYGAINTSNLNLTGYDYLQFKYYYSGSGTADPYMDHVYLELEDSSGNKVSTNLAGFTKANRSWTTLTVPLDKFSGDSGFSWSAVTKVKFEYDYHHNAQNTKFYFYLKDFVFQDEPVSVNQGGLVKAQSAIPDYNSIKSDGSSDGLQPAYQAIYEKKQWNSAGSALEYTDNNVVTSGGNFTLKDQEGVLFSDQFRRGSYMNLTESAANITPNLTDVFDVSWKMYEGEAYRNYATSTDTSEEVGTFATGDLIMNTLTAFTDTQMKSVTVEDGRTENGTTTNALVSGATKPTGTGNGAFVFRSYSDVSNEEDYTRLKVVYTNKVKTGSLTIKKEQGTPSSALNGSYTFTVVFSNVAGGNLEGSTPITKTISLSKGDSSTISGIPIGTEYRITETVPSDGSYLKSVSVSENGGTATTATILNGNAITGTIPAQNAEGTSTTEATFTNVINKTVDVTVTKQWKAEGGTDNTDVHPDSIQVKLKKTASTDGLTAQDVEKVTLYESDGFTHTWKNLDYYVDNSDTSKGYYTYSVVELDGSSNEIAANGEVTYTVNGSSSTYTESESSTEEKTDSNDADRVTAKNITITNTLKNKYYGFELTKVDNSNSATKLNGVEFSLYSDSSLNNIVNFTQSQSDATVYTYAATAQRGTTTTTLTTGGTDSSSNPKGVISVSGLPEGTYYLKETKAAPGYNMLDGTVTIVLGSSTTNGSATTTAKNGAISNGSYNSTTYTLSFTLSNTPGTALPSAGGRGITIFLELGAALIAVAAGLLVMKKRKLF